MKELQFLAGSFFDFELPKERQFLFRYFRTSIGKQFLRYYHCIGDIDHFSEHTGLRCKRRWLRRLRARLERLLALKAAAKQAMDLELLARIDSGKFKLHKKRPPKKGVV